MLGNYIRQSNRVRPKGLAPIREAWTKSAQSTKVQSALKQVRAKGKENRLTTPNSVSPSPKQFMKLARQRNAEAKAILDAADKAGSCDRSLMKMDKHAFSEQVAILIVEGALPSGCGKELESLAAINVKMSGGRSVATEVDPYISKNGQEKSLCYPSSQSTFNHTQFWGDVLNGSLSV